MRYVADLSGKPIMTLGDIQRLTREKPDLFYHRPGPGPSITEEEAPGCRPGRENRKNRPDRAVRRRANKREGEPDMVNKHADIVIVGVGAAGAILARELTEAGFTVLGIDKGPYYHSDDFWTKFDELRYSTRAGLSPTMDTDPMTWRPNAQTPAQILP